MTRQCRDAVNQLLTNARSTARPASRWTYALLILWIATAPVPAPAQTAKPAAAAGTAGDAARGKGAYARAGCAGCHGASGQGASALRIVPMSHPLDAFMRIVRHPAAATMPSLPPAAASDSDVADLHAFLRSLAPADQATAQAGGNADNGKRLYEAVACYACHGYAGQGGAAGPRLGPPPIALAAFTRALRHPREEMPPYTAKVLSDQQVADIYAYVKTFPEPPDVNTIPLLKKP